MKTAILVDSVAGLKPDLTELDNVFVAKLSVYYPDGTQLVDTIDDQEIDAFFKKMDSLSTLPTTSQPTFGELHELFESIIAAGYDRVFGLTISSKLSGTYQSMHQVAEEFSHRIEAHIVDSRSAACVMEEVVYQIKDLVANEAPSEQILDTMMHVLDNSQIYIVVDNLTNLRKGGRLSASSAMLGTLLRVKPLLYVDETGELLVKEKLRTTRVVQRRLIELVQQAQQQTNNRIKIGLLYTNSDALQSINDLESALKEACPGIETRRNVVSPVVSTHIGSGGYGIGIMPN